MFTLNIQMMFSLKDIVLNLIYSEMFVKLGNQYHYTTTKITFTLRSFKVSFLSKFLTTYILKAMHKRNMYQITSKLFSVNTSAILFIQSIMKFISFSHFSKTNGFPWHFHIFVLFCFVFWSHSSYQFSVNCRFLVHFHFLCCFSLTLTWVFSILLFRGTLEWKW